ncbi:MAG: SpoIIE family protein phosphatase [Actinomycetota bacterium]
MDAHLVLDRAPLIDWAVAGVALAGEVRSGDLHVVKEFASGALIAVVDGLGHGEEAAEAAGMAVTTLGEHAEEPVEALVRRCNEMLRGTRGVAMSLVSLNATGRTMSCLGVGNVECVLIRAGHAAPARESVMLRGGVVGYSLPPLRASVFPYSRGDTLIFATDGVGPGFVAGLSWRERPQQAADRILADFGKGNDDALVLVARVLGDPA